MHELDENTELNHSHHLTKKEAYETVVNNIVVLDDTSLSESIQVTVDTGFEQVDNDVLLALDVTMEEGTELKTNDNVDNDLDNSSTTHSGNELMEQIELLRMLLQTVCLELNLKTGTPRESSSALTLPIWFDSDNSARELQERLQLVIQRMTYNPSVLDVKQSDWVEQPSEDSSSVPPFGLESPIITHMLGTWTTDQNKIDFLKSWIRSLQSPASAGYPLGIQITNVSSVVRDGFMVLLVPLIRNMSTTDRVCVLVRQHHIDPRLNHNRNRASSNSSGVNSDSDALFERDRGVIDFSDSDDDGAAGGTNSGDPFVSLERGIVYDIRIKRLLPADHQNVTAPRYDHRYAKKRDNSTDQYSMDSHFPELYSTHHKAALVNYRTDSHDYSSLSEINTALDDMDKIVAQKVAATHPVHPHTEEPYNENKPIIQTATAQLNTLNSLFTSWFSQTPATTVTTKQDEVSVVSKSIINTSNITTASSTGNAMNSTAGPLRSVINEQAAADIIAASLASKHDSVIEEALPPSRTASQKSFGANKISARLEAMRKK